MQVRRVCGKGPEKSLQSWQGLPNVLRLMRFSGGQMTSQGMKHEAGANDDSEDHMSESE